MTSTLGIEPVSTPSPQAGSPTRPTAPPASRCPEDSSPNCCWPSVTTEQREEKASVAIASNESFSGWTKTFTDPRLCAAIVDRLIFGGTIIETGTDSYRLAQRTKLVNA